jgi:translation initiation factor IF-2
MGKIRVQDLAKMMGVPNQDLMFKLKSIGVRVEGDDAHIDTDIIQAILQGKKLPHPREVILRDAPGPEEPAGARRRPGPRRPPTNPLRPQRPRTMIQRVDKGIQTIPTRERPPEPPPQPVRPPERRDERPAAQAAEPARPAAAAAPQPAASPGPARRPEAPQRPVAAPPAAAPAATGDDDRDPRKEKERKKGVKRPRPADADLRAYRGAPVGELEDEDVAGARPTATSRRRRRAERREEDRDAGKILSFKKGRPEGAVLISEGMTVRDFAERLGVKAKDLIAALFRRGILANINHVLDAELAQKLGEDLNVETMVVSFEEEIQLRQEQRAEAAAAAAGEGAAQPAGRVPRGPVVTIMGHVDHGKTSLLDAIRESKVVESEYGGITQHIGAYQVDRNGKKIVFLDTPGHEAFTMMRSRGAKATDVVVLVVAADDGVMPQTVEAIDHARAAKVPIVVAVNKIDKANANPDRVKKELADNGLMVEEWGGDTVAVPISALKREGIDDLLEMILLTSDLLELKANPELPAQGVVLEARKETGRGNVATVLVQNGTLKVGDPFVSGAAWGRVRAMSNDLGERAAEAPPATPVEVTGFQDLPEAGDTFQVVADEGEAREVASYRQQEARRRELTPSQGRMSLDQLFDKIQEGQVKELPVVLKADVQGSVEVLRDTLEKLGTEKVRVQVIHAAVGAISTNDVSLAAASEAVVIGFNVRPERIAAELADKEGVDIRLHTVIYELTDELKKAMAGLLDPTFREVITGHAEVRDTFKVPKMGVVAGCHVLDGTVHRSHSVRLLRDNVVVHEGKIGSLRRFKDDVSEVRAGFDCGIGLDRFQDFKPGDVIESFTKEEVAAEL